MGAYLVSRWVELCQQLAPAFTAPTLVTFLHVATGWALCRSRPTVTDLVRTIGPTLLGHAAKHWTAYEKFFYRAAWSLPELSRLLLGRVVVAVIDRCAAAPAGGTAGAPADVWLNVDDTTAGRHGRHVAWAGYFKDASASNAAGTVVRWAHNWVVGAVAVRPARWPDWVVCLPVLFDLYRKRGDCDGDRPFRTRQQIGADMIHRAAAALPGRRLRVGADGQYATRAMADAARADGADLVSRMRADAAIYAPPPKCRRPRRGRPPKKGKRLPTPRRIAARRTRGWRTVEVLVYGRRVRRRVLAVVCLWWRVAGDRPVKLLIVRDPSGVQKDDYLFCTDPSVPDGQIVERFAGRWPIEDAFRDGKQLCGFGQVQGWCPHTVERQAPFALIVQTLVKAWYLLCGADAAQAPAEGGGGAAGDDSDGYGWERPKEHPSYLDMLAALRRSLWSERLKVNSALTGRVAELLKPLQFTLCAAA
jgi:hypothetical protein